MQHAALTKKMMAQNEQALSDMRVNAERVAQFEAERKKYESKIADLQEEVRRTPRCRCHCRRGSLR